MINVLKKTFQTMFVYFVLGFLITINFQNPVTAAWSSNLRENTPVCTASGQQSALQIISDGAGGAIITWEDARNVHFDIYAQRVDAHGNVLWKKDGFSICSAPENQNRPRIVSDGAGGAISPGMMCEMVSVILIFMHSTLMQMETYSGRKTVYPFVP